MKTRLAFASIAITGALIVLIGVMSPQDALADRTRNSFVGSWIVAGNPNPPGPPPFTNLGTIHRDGTVVNSDPSLGGGHGVWKRVGPRKYRVRFLSLVPPNHPMLPPNAVVTVTGVITLHRRGNRASGPFLTTIEDEHGNFMRQFDGTVAFTRIRLR